VELPVVAGAVVGSAQSFSATAAGGAVLAGVTVAILFAACDTRLVQTLLFLGAIAVHDAIDAHAFALVAHLRALAVQ
jgi:hypothetical protein